MIDKEEAAARYKICVAMPGWVSCAAAEDEPVMRHVCTDVGYIRGGRCILLCFPLMDEVAEPDAGHPVCGNCRDRVDLLHRGGPWTASAEHGWGVGHVDGRGSGIAHALGTAVYDDGDSSGAMCHAFVQDIRPAAADATKCTECLEAVARLHREMMA